MESPSENWFEKKSVLVTGGAGFIGSHLTEALVRSEARVTVLDNLKAGTWSNLKRVMPSVRPIEGDVRDYRVVEHVLRKDLPHVVFHLAANASVPGSVDDPRYDFETNCGGTFVLLDSLRQFTPAARVVFASSAAVYGEPCRFPIVEATPLQPISPYGANKVSAEVQCQTFMKVYGTQVIIGRLFNTYGPRMPRFVVLDVLRKLRRNPECLEILGNGQQVRDFSYVSDVIGGLMMLAERGKPGEAYNIASGTSCSVTRLARLLLEILGLQGRTRLVYTGESWKGDAQHWEVDISKIRTLGYEPRMNLREGLESVVAWFERTVS